MKTRTNHYSSGKPYTQYFKVCGHCGNNYWANKRYQKFCGRQCSNERFRSIVDPMERFFREKTTRLRSNAKKRKIEFK